MHGNVSDRRRASRAVPSFRRRRIEPCHAAADACHIYASPERVTNLSNGFLQTRAFIHTGSSGGPVINSAGKIVSVVSQGGELELAKTRLLHFLRLEHFG